MFKSPRRRPPHEMARETSLITTIKSARMTCNLTSSWSGARGGYERQLLIECISFPLVFGPLGGCAKHQSLLYKLKYCGSMP